MKNFKLKLKVQKIESGGYHLLSTVYINDKKAHVVIDTGASRTVMDSNRIETFLVSEKIRDTPHHSTGLGTSTMKSALVTLHNFRLGELLIKKAEVVLLDLSHVNQSYREAMLPEIDGVIGSDLLRKYRATISFEKKLITLKK